ncbi:MAG: flavodoxin family protein [Spirochaetia bacterium]
MDVDTRHVLLVSGSQREKGNTDVMLGEIERELQTRGFRTDFVALRSYAVHSCIGCEWCRKDKTCTRFYDGMHLLYPLIEQAAGLVVGSPTYNYNITPEMKSFIDRYYPFFDFSSQRPGPYKSRLAGAGRKAVSVAIAEQHEQSEMGFTMPAMSNAFAAIGYEVVAEVPVTGHFSKGSVANDEEKLASARAAAGTLARALQSHTETPR